MAITNHERIGKGLDLLKDGLAPYVERELKSQHAQQWLIEVRSSVGSTQERLFVEGKDLPWDAASLLAVIWNQWNDVFKKTLGNAERSIVSELREVRNRWAHQSPFSGDNADRALDSIARLLTAVSATAQADEVSKMKMDLRRLIIEEQVRSEKRKAGGSLIEAAISGALKPWREVVNPHPDVASGRYQQAEFAADIWQVHLNEGAEEYRNPSEFFRRTYLTESLKHLLVGGIRRLSGEGGDPVVQLQTNFGGGKTHSMLALYHAVSGVSASTLSGMDALLAEAGVKALPKAKRVVLVGNKISPGNPSKKPDGTVVRTLWGELAYQLGGKKAYERIAPDDQKATNPGDILRELFNEYGPCLILIDEWVAYARQLHDQSDLPAGTFETQFSFAQALTESAKLAKSCLLVISLPASDTTGSPHAVADDVEVGGERGRTALARLRNVIGRVESSWTPATAEEGFEIVRRRLFEPLTGDQFKQKDVTARAFAEWYMAQRTEFPPECIKGDYEKRIQASYPIHPEVFDRLYIDWSTLVKFQRTRGVLRLMAAVIHCLWDKGDRNPLILPSTMPIDDSRVRDELTRYLTDNWKPIIEKDVDGPGSLPQEIDAEVTNLGKLHATRRVARTIYLGSAPLAGTSNRGIEDRRVKLGCVMPGESPQIFGDALRRLAGRATFLYQDGPRYWYSTQPTVTKVAEDRAEQLKRDPDKVVQEIADRLRSDLRNPGDFRRVHPFPQSSQDVSDDPDARLVVLDINHPYSKEAGNPAELEAKKILETRGNSPRLYRNALIFLAADRARLQDLDDSVRRYIAWNSIVREQKELNLDPHQVTQAENQRSAADATVKSRIPETFQWLLVPSQKVGEAEIRWDILKLTGQDSLAVRASKKLKADEHLLTSFAPTRLRMELDKIPLWPNGHVTIKDLVDHFGRYLYLPRLAETSILLQAIQDGVSLMSWEADSFAYADSFDDASRRYRGLRKMEHITISDPQSNGLLVNPDLAKEQINAEVGSAGLGSNSPVAQPNGTASEPKSSAPAGQARRPKRFHGTVSLDPARVGRDASRVAEEVISHLNALVGAKVKVTLEIEAEMPSGASESTVRTVTENSRTLKFDNHGFELE